MGVLAARANTRFARRDCPLVGMVSLSRLGGGRVEPGWEFNEWFGVTHSSRMVSAMNTG
jgi:hypothetical protein